MNQQQHTLKSQTTLQGVGIHSGQPATISFLPASIDHGIVFQRIDLEGQPLIEADLDNVSNLARSTTLSKNDASVQTVEHVLAALSGLQIDNVLITLDGPEVPIMDGSAQEFVKALKKVGTKQQRASRTFLELKENIFYEDLEKNIEYAALPHDNHRLTVMVDYGAGKVGTQYASLNKLSQFEKDIAPSRTFCFVHELEALLKESLILGGNLSNALVVADKAISRDELKRLSKTFDVPKVEIHEDGTLNNTKARFKNEPARHKLLDVMGDLTLLGKPLKAQIMAIKPGHAANIAFAKKIRTHMRTQKNDNPLPPYDPGKPPLFDINKITHIIPHQHPFLLIDKVYYLDKDSVAGIKNVTYNENFFQGHFPGNPVMPGVLLIETMAQLGAVLVQVTVPNADSYWTYFLGIDHVRFRKMVVPGDTLHIHCRFLTPVRRGIAKVEGRIYVNQAIVCEGEIIAAMVRKDL